MSFQSKVNTLNTVKGRSPRSGGWASNHLYDLRETSDVPDFDDSFTFCTWEWVQSHLCSTNAPWRGEECWVNTSAWVFQYFLFCTLEALSAYAWHVFDQLMSLSASVAFCLKVEILDSGECTNNFCSHSGRVKKKGELQLLNAFLFWYFLFQ